MERFPVEVGYNTFTENNEITNLFSFYFSPSTIFMSPLYSSSVIERGLGASYASDLTDSYLEKLDWQVNENANVSYSLHGMRNYVSSEVTKEYVLNKIYPENIAKLHRDGDLHIHDLGELNAYCGGWDLQDLLRLGFNGVNGKIHCKPATHLHAALGQLVNFFYTMQGELAGAQAVSSFDTLLAPFIRYDKLEFPALKQCLQTFLFNMNVPTRVGFQTPFTNVTLDLTVPKTLADQHIIIGGEYKPEKYSDFQAEMDLFNKAFAEVMSEGDGVGRLFSFPIPTYNLTEDFDWDNPVLESLWEMTAKYGLPNFANYINSELSPEDSRSMCCRLRLDNRELRRRGGGLFGASPLTGSIGVVTLNLPRLGYESNSILEFKAKLLKLMEIASESLEIKREVIEDLTDKGLYPYCKHFLSLTKQRFGTYWGNHFATIGIVGMNEALLNLIGEDITTPVGQVLAADILDLMRDKIKEIQEDSGNLYNLEATPAEGTSYRLAKADMKKYAEQKAYLEHHHKVLHFANFAGLESGKSPYYTNSSQLPVGFTNDPFEALDLQDELQTKYTGGTMFHLFLGERLPNIQAVKKLVKQVAQSYHLPYFTITPTFSICPTHGYLSGETRVCPHCEAKTEVYSRVVGYIRPVDQWNHGKKEEYQDRLEYVV